jgi:hypothetical protein
VAVFDEDLDVRGMFLDESVDDVFVSLSRYAELALSSHLAVLNYHKRRYPTELSASQTSTKPRNSPSQTPCALSPNPSTQPAKPLPAIHEAHVTFASHSPSSSYPRRLATIRGGTAIC